MNIAVLGSTSGTDLQEIIDKLENNSLKNINLKFVLSNKKNAGILKRAKNYTPIFLDPKGKDKEEYDKEIHKLIKKYDVNLILLIGYLKFMSDWFVNKYRNKVMNIHPSLLPMFAGDMDTNVHQNVLDYGCKVSGATLMFIDEGVDTGPVILQKALNISKNETVESLKNKIQDIEKELIIKGIELFRDNRIKITGRIVKCN